MRSPLADVVEIDPERFLPNPPAGAGFRSPSPKGQRRNFTNREYIEKAFQCGFRHFEKTFSEYLEHIRTCKNAHCVERYLNHQDVRERYGLKREVRA